VRSPLARRLTLLSVLAAAACVSKPNAGSLIFSIDPPPLASKTPALGARIVSVDRVEVAPEFVGRSLTYRTGIHSFERDPYAVLAASPRDLVLALLRTSLGNADFVRDVVETGGPVTPDFLVEAYVSDLEGDFTVKDKPVAVVGLEIVVLSVPEAPAPVVSLLRKAYTRRLPLPENTANAVANAWNQGLTSIVEEFVTDMRASLPPPPTSKPAGAPR
jgi:ABC-type transport auxiliary lipoprotein component